MVPEDNRGLVNDLAIDRIVDTFEVRHLKIAYGLDGHTERFISAAMLP